MCSGSRLHSAVTAKQRQLSSCIHPGTHGTSPAGECGHEAGGQSCTRGTAGEVEDRIFLLLYFLFCLLSFHHFHSYFTFFCCILPPLSLVMNSPLAPTKARRIQPLTFAAPSTEPSYAFSRGRSSISLTKTGPQSLHLHFHPQLFPHQSQRT